jgi:hypothetical protein
VLHKIIISQYYSHTGKISSALATLWVPSGQPDLGLAEEKSVSTSSAEAQDVAPTL